MPSSPSMLSVRPPARRWFSFRPCALICADTDTFRLLRSIARRTRPRAPAGSSPHPIRHPLTSSDVRTPGRPRPPPILFTTPGLHDRETACYCRQCTHEPRTRTIRTPNAYAYAYAGDGLMHTRMRTTPRSGLPPARPPIGGCAAAVLMGARQHLHPCLCLWGG